MLIIDPSTTILSYTTLAEQHIETCARVCYKSEDKITKTSHKAIIKSLINKGHEAMLEHATATVLFVTNRGVSHELVRHRVASFAQESTRYVNYGNKGCCFIRPVWYSQYLLGEYKGTKRVSPFVSWEVPAPIGEHREAEEAWLEDMAYAETAYNRQLRLLKAIDGKDHPEKAREVLPNSTKTEIVITANFREWRHIFNLRAVGKTGRPHPEMVRVMNPLLDDFINLWPTLFGDLR